MGAAALSRTSRLSVHGIFMLCLLAGCASVPDVDPDIGRIPTSASAPTILGSRGPLTVQQSKALIAQLGAAVPGDAGVLQRHLAIETMVAETPLIAGNRVQLLRNGPDAFQAIFATIQAARNTINIESFILEDVVTNGQSLGDLLIAKRRDGVTVNVIYDSFGTSATPKAFFDRLLQAGIALVDFNPLNPLVATGTYAPDHRDHRKLLVVDGAVAILGGVNLSHDYQSGPHGASYTPPEAAPMQWRDTDLLLNGPAAALLQALFVAHWQQQSGPPLDPAIYFPPIAPKGTEIVRIIGSSPDHAVPRFYVTLLSAIRNAEASISITAAYFVPTHQEMEDLIAAARRGVRVRLLLPDASDSNRAIDVAHAHYDDLLEAGVSIFETHNLVLHAKTVVVDTTWSVVGSSNFDQRSIIFNDEIDAVVLGRATGQALEGMFDADQRAATPIDRAAWARRPLTQNLRELASRLWEHQL